MNKYEMMTIAKIDLGEDGARKLSNSIKDIITSLKGKVLNSDFWGKRKFGYEINHDQEGYYDVLEFELDPKSHSKFVEKLNLTENLVRYLITSALGG